MIITPTRIHLYRTVTRGSYGDFSITEVTEFGDPEDWKTFRGELVPPELDSVIAEEDSPREQDPWILRWPTNTLAPVNPPAHPGDRVEIEGELYELLNLPRKLRSGRRTVGVEVAVMPVSTLYPTQGVLQDQGGQLWGDIFFAMWSPGETHTGAGDYRTWQAEAPPEFARVLGDKNRQILVPDMEPDLETVYRVVDPMVILASPRVRFTMRGAR